MPAAIALSQIISIVDWTLDEGGAFGWQGAFGLEYPHVGPRRFAEFG
jgi:hypothetical protein